MPNKTVYISSENEEAWEKFKAQYGSVNNFLTSSSPKVLTEMGEWNPRVKVRGDDGFCKIHGLALDSRGRCLQKGCKYA